MQHGNFTGARYFHTNHKLQQTEINTSNKEIPNFFCVQNPSSLIIQATKTSFEVQGWLLTLDQIDATMIQDSLFVFMKIPLKSKSTISKVQKSNLNFFTWFDDSNIDEEISVNIPGSYFLIDLNTQEKGLDSFSFDQDKIQNLKKPYFFHFSRNKALLDPTVLTINNHYNGVSIDGETCEFHYLYQVIIKPSEVPYFDLLDPIMNPSVDCEDDSDSFRWWHWFVIAIGIVTVLSIIFLLVMFFVFGITCCCQCPDCANVGEESWGREKYKEKYEGSSSVSPVAF